ncbi:OmpW family protein [Gemmatimonas sp.]|uniref:OmpW/AlkL family protein n=1 Tax=Gemmatimonas sp. TaxID=1962908 RepID=UPI00356812ED
MFSAVHRILVTAAFTVLPAALTAQAAAPAATPAVAPVPPKPTTEAAEGKFLLRVRGLGLITGDKSDAVPLLGLPADRITASDVAFAELDLSYFVTSHVALSVSGSYPVSHDAFINGTKIGTFKQTSLTARAMVYFWPTARVRPYVGAGVFVAPISNVDLAANGVGRFGLDTPAVGPVGQLGADIKLSKRVFLNADVRYALVKTTLTAGLNPVSDLGLNPLTFGGGIGVRF